MSDAELVAALRAIVGEANVRTDPEALALASHDVHLVGETPAAVVRPADAQALAAAVGAATRAGYAVLPRGGGLSYTGGYASPTPRAITVDLGGMNRILDISPADMTITVEAGVTWKQIHAALKPHGLRLPFIGTFSGAGATVGGGLGQGALFFGSARYGSAAEIVLGLEVALADGTLLRTGQGALSAGSKPFLRTYGPDLTGLFTHDGGMFGVKTHATFRLIETPAEYGYASFAFQDLETAADALSAIARADVAEEVYILDPSVAAASEADGAAKARTAASIARAAGGPIKALRALASLAKGGTGFIPPGCFSLHLTAAGRSLAAVRADLEIARAHARACGGREIAPTIPRVARAELFANLNGVFGPDGGRWAALNAKVAHSDARALIRGFDDMMAPFQAEMAARGVRCTRLVSSLANHCFSFEPVFHWRDRWQPIHRVAVDPAHLAGLVEPSADPAARTLVDRLREETATLFRSLGAASNQIGRTYPFREALSPPAEQLLAAIKAQLDPTGRMNPGVLGFAAEA
jgi:FAD/FMN-containing dehydrogenase